MRDEAPVRTLVIGVGNEFRCDDAVGILLARQVRARELPGVEVVEASGEGASLMDLWKDAPRVILLDAVQRTGAIGTVHRIDAREREVPSDFFHYSTHAFSVAEAVELARALNQLPDAVVIYGVEGGDYSMGQTLSPRVVAVLDDVEARVVDEIRGESHA